ncbi:6-pyruvoyl trahydropterin synthase family protein [Nocardia blacklockiae]|uniref:6-pyruvoyl trahydropterin synthase family protein n=1 Tax=Nocardia blacklockiae TaxID=480036 RepID=UPI0018950853|nr:6-carboxytetrahydropterin synthase [Nocardia blacklockiae]MBF6175997.1 6-carboxytetrahydropterin synthase [Nocardia blacklockiae]
MNLSETVSGTTSIEIGGGEFRFPAAHTGWHDGEFEPLHGHTYIPVLRLRGGMGKAGMVADFSAVKAALRHAITPLRRRVLLAADCPGVVIEHEGDSVRVASPGKRYVFPAGDTVVLPITNTSTELLATYLLEQLLPVVAEHGVDGVELELSEAPGTAATARADFILAETRRAHR